MAENDFVLFNTMAINRHEILAVVPQYDEDKSTFQITVISKQGVPLEVVSGIASYDEALQTAQQIAKIFEVGLEELQRQQALAQQHRAQLEAQQRAQQQAQMQAQAQAQVQAQNATEVEQQAAMARAENLAPTVVPPEVKKTPVKKTTKPIKSGKPEVQSED